MQTTRMKSTVAGIGVVVVAVASAAGLRRLFAERSHGRDVLVEGSDRAAQWLRHTVGLSEGLRFRLVGREQAPDVSDSERVDASRSSMRGRHAPASPMLATLRAAIADCGVAPGEADDVIGVGLHALIARLPVGEAHHLEAHLPADVLRLVGGPRRDGQEPSELATVPEFADRLAAATELDPGRAESAVRAITRTVRKLVPEEAEDIAAVLPVGLKSLWLADAGR